MAVAVDHYKMVVLFVFSLFIVSPIICVFCALSWFCLQYFVYFVSCNQLAGEERVIYFTFIVFLMSCDCNCCLSLLYIVIGWSAVCKCDISWSHSLAFYTV